MKHLKKLTYCYFITNKYFLFVMKYNKFQFVVCKDTLSSVLFGSLQEVLWVRLHFSSLRTTPKPLQLSMLTERLPVGLMSSVVAPEKPSPNTMGPKEVRINISYKQNLIVVESWRSVSMSTLFVLCIASHAVWILHSTVTVTNAGFDMFEQYNRDVVLKV